MSALRFTLRQLEIFSAVARSNSTSSAAGDISLSQSAVSAALNELELTLGFQLFHRVGKRLVLNDSGRAFNSRAIGLIEAARGIERDFDGSDPASHLCIGASTTIGNYLIPRLLADYAATRPGARVDVKIGNTMEVLRAVSEFKVDAGVVEGPSSVPGLVLTPWRDDELVVVCAPGHPLAQKQRLGASLISLATLRETTWLIREEGSGTRDAVQSALSPHLGNETPSLVLGSSEAIKRAVILGLGISCMSRLLVEEHLQTGALIELTTELPRMSRSFHVVIHRERSMTPASEHFFRSAAG